jgi:hypothetical protein
MHIDGQYRADSMWGDIEIWDRSAHCDNCGRACDPDDVATVYTHWSPHYGARGSQIWCPHCADNSAFYCDATHDTYANDSGVDLADGSTVVQQWADRNCYFSDYSDDLFVTDDDAPVTMADGEVWATSEFEDHGFTCRVTGDNHPDGEMHPDHQYVHADVTDEALAEAGIIDAANDDDDATPLAEAA